MDHQREIAVKDAAGHWHCYKFDTKSTCRKCGAVFLAGQEKEHAQAEHLIDDAYAAKQQQKVSA